MSYAEQVIENKHHTDLAQRLTQCIAPVFQQAAEQASHLGVASQVQQDITGLPYQLAVHAIHPVSGKVNHYSLSVHPLEDRVTYETHDAHSGETWREVAPLAALNEKVVDTGLEAFYRELFGLHLELFSQRHPIGF
jgi:hypothetical protein